ncbi:hypothetical protein HYT24_01470 [Candidatus Pacearchaeota archaeon]|nr:hypothetical protein [Candidatus Pacearchaeota archaeon]
MRERYATQKDGEFLTVDVAEGHVKFSYFSAEGDYNAFYQDRKGFHLKARVPMATMGLEMI